MGQYYFSGSNSGEGFHNYFDGVVPSWEKLTRYFMIKGGPGVGKSTLMKRVAEQAETQGETVERFYCSGDPDSLDAVRLVERGIVFADATAPHCMDPSFPGAVGEIVNLGEQIDREHIVKYREQVETLTLKNKLSYRRAYAFLGAAAALEKERYMEIFSAIDRVKLTRFAQELTDVIQSSEGENEPRKLFLDAISCKGRVSFASQAEEGNTVYRVIGTYKDVITDVLATECKTERKELFYSPLRPNCANHMLCREQGVFLTSGKGTGGQAISAEIFLRKKPHTSTEVYFAEARRMEEEAMNCLKECKKIHDELENIYKECVDFAAVSERTEQLLALLETL